MSVVSMVESASVKYLSLIKKISKPLAQSFDINYFCYQSISDDNHWFTLGNHPDWLLYSAEHHFYRYDPSLVKPCQYSSGYCFPQYHQDKDFQRTLISHAQEKFNIHHPLVIIKRLEGKTDFFFLGADKESTEVYSHYMNHRSLLANSFVHHFYQEISHYQQAIAETTVNLSDLRLPVKPPLAINNISRREASFLEQIQSPCLLLSPREKQCLELYRAGMTAKQTAKKLALSYRTVEEHFENMKAKLNINHKRELLNYP